MALRNGESVGFNAFQLEPTKANLISLKALVGRLRDCLRRGGQAGAPLVDGVDEWVRTPSGVSAGLFGD